LRRRLTAPTSGAALPETVLKGNFAVPSLTLLYESALMPAIIRGGRPSGAGELCVHLHRRPGIDRGGGFCLEASGWFEVRFKTQGWCEQGIGIDGPRAWSRQRVICKRKFIYEAIFAAPVESVVERLKMYRSLQELWLDLPESL